MSRNRYVMTAALTAILVAGFFVVHPAEVFAANGNGGGNGNGNNGNGNGNGGNGGGNNGNGNGNGGSGGSGGNGNGNGNGGSGNSNPVVVLSASDVTAKTTFMQPVKVQLVASGNGTFTYEIVAQPAHGAITGFDNTTGALTYTPNGQIGFSADSFKFRVVDSSNSTNTSNNATVTVNVEGESHHFYVIAEGFANAHPEYKNVKNIPESFDATANSVQFGQHGTNLFDVLHYLDLQGLGRNQITDGQFVWLMENIF